MMRKICTIASVQAFIIRPYPLYGFSSYCLLWIIAFLCWLWEIVVREEKDCIIRLTGSGNFCTAVQPRQLQLSDRLVKYNNCFIIKLYSSACNNFCELWWIEDSIKFSIHELNPIEEYWVVLFFCAPPKRVSIFSSFVFKSRYKKSRKIVNRIDLYKLVSKSIDVNFQKITVHCKWLKPSVLYYRM